MSSSFNVDYQKKDLPKRIQTIGLTLFVIGLITAVAGYAVDATRSSFSNIIILMFLISVGLGALFLVALEYVAGAVWSVPFRRIAEFFAAVLFIAFIVSLPLLFNLDKIFVWMHPQVLKEHKALAGKAPYLNTNFFIIRVIAFFFIWLSFYYFIIKNSSKQDSTKSQSITTVNTKISAIFMPVFAFTISFSAIDWLMSLEPNWFSTIFGVYYFSGTVLAALAVVTITVVLLDKHGFFVKKLNPDQYYSFGALLFAFTNFWAYIAFSQYMLIWYANLPEETAWFITRWEGSWKFISIGLILFQFVIPYIGLLSQPSKMDPKRLLRMASIILFAHFYDLYWMVMPEFNKGGILFGWIEIGFTLLAAGIIILVFVSKVRKNNLIPVGDPKLQRGLEFKL